MAFLDQEPSVPAGRATLELLADNVVRITMVGRVGAEDGRRVASALSSALMAPPAKHTFWDLEAMESYHSDVRTLCTEALLAHLRHVAGVTVIAKSKLVKMGVAVANVALGGRITSIDERVAFEALVRTALRAKS